MTEENIITRIGSVEPIVFLENHLNTFVVDENDIFNRFVSLTQMEQLSRRLQYYGNAKGIIGELILNQCLDSDMSSLMRVPTAIGLPNKKVDYSLYDLCGAITYYHKRPFRSGRHNYSEVDNLRWFIDGEGDEVRAVLVGFDMKLRSGVIDMEKAIDVSPQLLTNAYADSPYFQDSFFVFVTFNDARIFSECPELCVGPDHMILPIGLTKGEIDGFAQRVFYDTYGVYPEV